jgi:hypothetical protein
VHVVHQRLTLGESASGSGPSNALDVELLHVPPDADRANASMSKRMEI